MLGASLGPGSSSMHSVVANAMDGISFATASADLVLACPASAYLTQWEGANVRLGKPVGKTPNRLGLSRLAEIRHNHERALEVIQNGASSGIASACSPVAAMTASMGYYNAGWLASVFAAAQGAAPMGKNSVGTVKKQTNWIKQCFDIEPESNSLEGSGAPSGSSSSRSSTSTDQWAWKSRAMRAPIQVHVHSVSDVHTSRTLLDQSATQEYRGRVVNATAKVWSNVGAGIKAFPQPSMRAMRLGIASGTASSNRESLCMLSHSKMIAPVSAIVRCQQSPLLSTGQAQEVSSSSSASGGACSDGSTGHADDWCVAGSHNLSKSAWGSAGASVLGTKNEFASRKLELSVVLPPTAILLAHFSERAPSMAR